MHGCCACKAQTIGGEPENENFFRVYINLARELILFLYFSHHRFHNGCWFFGLWWYEPSINGYGQVLQQAVMFCQLRFESIKSDSSGCAIAIACTCNDGSVMKKRAGQLIHFTLVKFHSVFIHTSSHYMLQLFFLDQTIACNAKKKK